MLGLLHGPFIITGYREDVILTIVSTILLMLIKSKINYGSNWNCFPEKIIG